MNNNRAGLWLRALAQPTTYLGVAMLAFIFAALSYLLIQSRAVEEDDAKRSGENVVRLYAESVSRLLTNADNTLLLLRRFYETHPDETDFIQWPTQDRFRKDLTLQYSLIGPDGAVKASTYGPSALGLNISDMEHFAVQAATTADRLFVSKPIYLRNQGKWGIVLTRRLTAPDGSFAGILASSLDLSQVQSLFQNLQLGTDSGVSLIDFDGVIYSRTARDASQASIIGQKFPNAGVLKRAASQRSGDYWNQPGALDGVKRLVSYRVIEGLPLIAVAGISEAEVLNQWTKVARSYLAIAALLTLTILVAIAVGAVREKRLIAAKDELERVNLWFDTALDNMSQGLTMYDASERLLLVNHRYMEMYGLTPEQMKTGDTICEIVAKRTEMGMTTPEQINAYLEKPLRELRAGRPVDKIVETRHGRFYAVSLRPLKIGGWVTTHQDVTEQTRAEREVLHLAHHDTLTELTSRALFQSQVNRAVSRLGQSGERFNILLLDLDRFKAVNDLLGHLAGDRLLQQVAVRLKSCVQATDVVARLGGDEFAILQPVEDDPQERAVALAERLLHVVGAPYDLDGYRVNVETSIGIVLAPEHGREAEQLIKNADLALYQAKAGGGDAWRLFEPVMEKQARARYELEIDLRRSIECGEFDLHYQPVIDALSRETVGCRGLGALDASPARDRDAGRIHRHRRKHRADRSARGVDSPTRLRGCEELAVESQGRGESLADPVRQGQHRGDGRAGAVRDRPRAEPAGARDHRVGAVAR